MLDTNDTEYYNVNGIQIIDPSINHDEVLLEGMFSGFHHTFFLVFLIHWQLRLLWR